MSAEQWKPAPGIPGIEVSDLGRARFTSNQRPSALTMTNSGYWQVQKSHEGKRYRQYLHALVAEAFHGPRPEGNHCRHLNGDKHDNRASNLAWGSVRENVQDTLRMGRNFWKSKTHCPQGHPYDAENTVTIPSRPNGRYCKACQPIYRLNRQLRASGSAVSA